MKKRTKEGIGLVLIAGFLIALASAATIFAFKMGILTTIEGAAKIDPRLYDIMDARRACWDYVGERFGKSQRHIRVDELSTRFEKSRNVFLVFFSADFPNSDSNSKEYPDGLYLECRIDPDTQEVSHFGTTNETGRPEASGFNNFGVMGS